MTQTAEYQQLRDKFQKLSNSYLFTLQFFAESARIEKAWRRAGDAERLRAIRQSADYEKPFRDENPLISVIIPTYSRAQIVIDRTIPSILAQTYGNWEVIIVGDQMAEAEASLLAGVEHPRIRFINLKKRGRYPLEKGPLWYVAGIKPMNFGLRIARGQWIAHLDDDDEFDPQHLELLLHTARSQRAEWAHGKVRFVDDDGSEAGTVGGPQPREGGIARISSIYHGQLKTFRYNQTCWKYHSPGDWDIWDRFLCMGVRHAHLPMVTATHHGGLDRVGEATNAKKPLAPLEQGIACYQNQQQEEAIEQLSRAIELDPGSPLAYAYLAFICAEQGLPEDAAAFIGQAAAIAPERHDLLAALGEVFLKAGNASEAQKYLEAAVQKQPDMFMAYPALAEALRRNGDGERAIQLLASAVGINSAARENILTSLIEILTQKGDLKALAETSIRVRNSQSIHSLGIRLLTRTDCSPARIAEEQAWHVDSFLPPAARPAPSKPAGTLLNIAFLISDFEREAQLGRFEALLRHLPPEAFRTLVIDNDIASNTSETAQRCSLICDHWEIIREQDDASASRKIAALQPDILIDFDGHGPRQRLALLRASTAPLKASWASGPPGKNSGIAWLRGAALRGESSAGTDNGPAIELPGLGEICLLPAVDPSKEAGPTTFGCLSPAIQISEDTWHFYAELLGHLPASRLRINLDKLGAPAQAFISGLFASRDIAPERLEFVHAATADALCTQWRSIAIGLAPLHGSGEMAVSTCLWMNTPLVALATESAGSQRPAAFLTSIGHPELVAGDRQEYLAIALRLAAGAPSINSRQAIEAAQLTDSARLAGQFGAALSQAYFGNRP